MRPRSRSAQTSVSRYEPLDVACVVPLVELTVAPLLELLAVEVAVVVLLVPDVPLDADDAALLQAVRATVPARDAATSATVVARTFRSPLSRVFGVGDAVVLATWAAV